jgi:hypothetical protein
MDRDQVARSTVDRWWHGPKAPKRSGALTRAFWVTPRIVNVLQISKECWRWALASSDALPQNGLCCTMLMRAGLSSKLLSPLSVSGLVLTLAQDGAEKSLMHLWAAISAGSCGSDEPWNWLTISRTWDLKDPGEESLDRDFLIGYSGSNGNWLVNWIRSCNSLWRP